MRLCLRCFRLYPLESVWCPRCHRTFDRKLCPNDHANPINIFASTCLICNQGPLSPATYSISLRALPRLLALITLLLAIRWIFLHFGYVVCLLESGTLRIAAWITGSTACQVARSVNEVTVWLIALWIVSYFLPASSGNALRGTIQSGLKRCGMAIRTLLKGLRWWV